MIIQELRIILAFLSDFVRDQFPLAMALDGLLQRVNVALIQTSPAYFFRRMITFCYHLSFLLKSCSNNWVYPMSISNSASHSGQFHLIVPGARVLITSSIHISQTGQYIFIFSSPSNSSRNQCSDQNDPYWSASAEYNPDTNIWFLFESKRPGFHQGIFRICDSIFSSQLY